MFQEHEAELMSIHKQPKETLEDKAAYDELKALNHYNKPAGVTLLKFSYEFELNDELNLSSFDNEDSIFITHPF